MNIKHRFCAVLSLLVTQACISQTISPDLLTVAGGYQTNASCSLCWTIGEPFIETGASANDYLTQGFQQPETIIINNADNTSANSAETITAYPNPVSSVVYLKSTSDAPIAIEVRGLSGQLFLKKGLTGSINELNLGSLADGIYFLKVYTSNSKLLETIKLDKIR